MGAKTVRMPFEVSFDLFVNDLMKGNFPVARFATKSEACAFAVYATEMFPGPHNEDKRRYHVKKKGTIVFATKR